jgi:hypothetical protein
VVLFLSLWYLNLPHIKMIFHSQSLENLPIEETTANDPID